MKTNNQSARALTSMFFFHYRAKSIYLKKKLILKIIIFQQTIGNLDLMIIFDILCVIVSLMWPFGLCYAATMTTTSSLQMAEIIYNANWYNFPHELRKYLPLMIARSQLEISFYGFGIVVCNLKNFVKVSCHNI